MLSLFPARRAAAEEGIPMSANSLLCCVTAVVCNGQNRGLGTTHAVSSILRCMTEHQISGSVLELTAIRDRLRCSLETSCYLAGPEFYIPELETTELGFKPTWYSTYKPLSSFRVGYLGRY